MSQNSLEKITCPQCGKESSFTVWQSVNTDLDPEMKAAVKDLSIFRFTCPHCGYSAMVDYGMLYHQMRDKIMIQYAESDERVEEAKSFFSGESPQGKLMSLFGSSVYDGYLIRIVRSINELREKIEIFDAGLDDRIIEIYKTFLRIMAAESYPKAKNIQMLFFQKDRRNFIQVIADGETVRTMELISEVYDGLKEEFLPVLPDIRKDELIIDKDYAFRCYSLLGKR